MQCRTIDRVTVRDRTTFYAPGELGKTRRVTPEGYLLCEGVAIARTGTQTYGKNELKNGETGETLLANGDDQVIVDRVPDEVFRPETIASFEGKSITVEHPNDFVKPENYRDHEVGHVQNVRRGEGVEDDLLLADFLIKDPAAIAYVNRDLPEVSCGYDSGYEQTEAGKAIQRNIIGNHVALVDRGRAGPRCAIKDTSIGEDFMPKVKNSTTRSFMRMLAAFQSKDEKAVATELEKIEDDEPDEATGMMDAEMKKEFGEMKDWIKDRKARDTAEEEEKVAKAAEEAKKKKESEDSVTSAEVLPKLVDLGKVYTGDSAGDAPIKEVFSRAEILSPGIAITKDSLKQDGALSALLLKALTTADSTQAGKECIAPFLMNRELRNLTGDGLLGVFTGAAELMRQRNNRAASVASVTTKDFGKPATIASINEANRKHWAR